MQKIAGHLETNKADVKAKRTKLIKYSLILAAIILIFFVLIRPMFKKFNSNIASRIPDKSASYQSLDIPGETTKLGPTKDSLIKKYLLLKINNSFNSSTDIFYVRNIFKDQTRPSSSQAGKNINEDKPKEPEPQQIIPPLKLKLIGIVTKRDDKFPEKNTLMAILADENGTYFVKKGDVLMDQYQIVDIGEETVEIRNIQFNKNDTLKLIR